MILIGASYIPSTILDSGNMMNKTNNPCPHEEYILVGCRTITK